MIIHKTHLLFICMLFFSMQIKAITPDTIKVLAIGNSFSQDAVENYLYDLGKAKGHILIIGNICIAGCSIEKHLYNAQNDLPAYRYYKINAKGKLIQTENITMGNALTDEKWDYISLQQASALSGIYDSYKKDFPVLVNYIKQRVSPKTILMLHQTWAYANNASHIGFKHYHSNQLNMYTAIVNSIQKAANLVGIKKIIPTGTAIQNVRTSFIGDNLNRDGYHLNYGTGRYTAACIWFESLTGENIIGNPYYPKNLTAKEVQTIQKAAHAAILAPDRITNYTIYVNY